MTYAKNQADSSTLIPGGIFCDPQIGCSDKIAGADLSSAYSKQFSQEIRLQSHFRWAGEFQRRRQLHPLQTQDDYYVFYNMITLLGMTRPFNKAPDRSGKAAAHWIPRAVGHRAFSADSSAVCRAMVPSMLPTRRPFAPYIDPNPIESINGQGHNYFRSSNPYRLKSWAAFGEFYWNINDDLKLTAGLRYTDDRKTFTPVPSQLLLGYGYTLGGTTAIGYPAKPDIKQHWGEFTGRLGLDWNPTCPSPTKPYSMVSTRAATRRAALTRRRPVLLPMTSRFSRQSIPVLGVLTATFWINSLPSGISRPSI